MNQAELLKVQFVKYPPVESKHEFLFRDKKMLCINLIYKFEMHFQYIYTGLNCRRTSALIENKTNHPISSNSHHFEDQGYYILGCGRHMKTYFL